MESKSKNYFSKFYNGIASAIKGMVITFRHLGREPITVEYPDVDVEKLLPESYRGFLDVDLKICVSCRLCERGCPIDCIAIEDVKAEKSQVPTKDGTRNMIKLKNPTKFDIDIAKCMFCGLCVEACPTGAIKHTRKFTGCVFDVNDLIFSFVTEDDRKEFIALAEEIKQRDEKKKEE